MTAQSIPTTDQALPGRDLRVVVGFLMIYLAAWLTALALDGGPSMLMQWLGVAEGPRTLIGTTLSRLGVLAAQVGLSAWALRRFTSLRAQEVMFPVEPGWGCDLLVGVALAAGAMGLLFAVDRSAGWLTVEGWRGQERTLAAWLGTVWLGLLANLLAAVGEEALLRGYLLTGLSQAWGGGVGLALVAVLFAIPPEETLTADSTRGHMAPMWWTAFGSRIQMEQG